MLNAVWACLPWNYIIDCRTDSENQEQSRMEAKAYFPKLTVRWWTLGSKDKEITCEFKEAKDVVFSKRSSGIVFCEGIIIRSYEDLVELASQKQHEDKEVLTITIVVAALEGG